MSETFQYTFSTHDYLGGTCVGFQLSGGGASERFCFGDPAEETIQALRKLATKLEEGVAARHNPPLPT